MKIINKNRQDKGITLIALVITIIVLLILAGVALQTTIGENGLFNSSKQSIEKINNEVQDDREDISKLEGANEKEIEEIKKTVEK